MSIDSDVVAGEVERPPKVRAGGRAKSKSKTKAKAHRPRRAEGADLDKVLVGVGPAWAQRIERLQAVGLHHRQVVYELHCREGLSLVEVAEILDISHETARYHWQQVRRLLLEHAPRTPEQMLMMREEIAARLWGMVEQTYGRSEVVEDGVLRKVETPPTPPMLAVRLRALEQIARLYGVYGEASAAGSSPALLPHEMPAELAVAVRQRQLEAYGRGEVERNVDL